MRRLLIILLSILTLVSLTSCLSIKTTENSETITEFHYQHDPAMDPKVLEDAMVNPDAVYGFSPRSDSKRLGSYANLDFTNPELVAKWKEDRIEYHEQIKDLYEILNEMCTQGCSTEEIARRISTRRNELRFENTEASQIDILKQSNLAKYGNEMGPTADSLFEKYGSWQMVLTKAFSTNHGMDACLGLYDEMYPYYLMLNEI